MQPIKYAASLALITAVISGTNNFLAKIAVTSIKDPIIYTSLKNAVVGVLLMGVVLGAKKLPEIKALTQKQAL